LRNYLELQEISQRYGRRQALINVNLVVGKGETTALIGANGAGKTSLLRIVSGLENPASGRILLGGQIADCTTLRKTATMVFQRTVMFNTNVYDNVAYGLRSRGMSRHVVDEKVQAALKNVGLEGFENRKAKRLSGGEQQRVSLARALVLEPDILVLDEPTANLDPRNASIVERVIAKANCEQGVTVVMASHNMAQARQLADRVAILQDGVLVVQGSASEVLDQPSSFLDNFLRPVNMFYGVVSEMENGLAVVDIGGGVKLQAANVVKGSVMVHVRPENVIVSKTPLVSSARNVLRGRILEACGSKELIQLKIDVGKEFVTMVTRKSFEEMKLTIGTEVFLTFKAQAVHAIEGKFLTGDREA
jgi:tungstate transport system ATP-binding protein